jgi:hypothetical protein
MRSETEKARFTVLENKFGEKNLSALWVSVQL